MRRVSWAVCAVAFGCLAVSFASGCGDSEKSGPESYVGETKSALVAAEKGGELAVGAVKIKVPAGALEKDTELTAKVHSKKAYPQNKDIAIDVYEFGPKGTTFSKDVGLEFDLKGVKLGKHRADVVELDEEAGEWKVLAGSKVSGGKVRATTKHFSFYAVLLTEISGGGSADAPLCDADYTACGGAIEGTWRFVSGCISAYAQSFPMPATPGTGAVCEDTSSGFVLSTSGTAVFGPEQSFSIEQTLVLDSSIKISVPCLEAAGQVPAEYCAETGGELSEGFCEVASTTGDVPADSSGTYMVDGANLLLESPDGYLPFGFGGLDPTLDYCVQGDTLTLRMRGESESENQVYVLERAEAAAVP